MNFTSLKLTRTDATVNFDWGGGSPDPSIGANTFTVRWTGKVEPQYSQTYTFYTQTDDGVRLWVNGQLLIDKWIDQGPTEWSGQIALTAGQRYDITMEFYENGGGAMAKLSWSSASQAKQIIPQSRLYPPGSTAQVDLRWLVTDHLGTPRMIIDKTGSLANVRRHDYLPFGEELYATQGLRTAALGYSGGDGIRQQFTQKERDIETGLDYFLARYYSSTHGRFTSPDEFQGGPVELFAEVASGNPTFFADLRKPQSLNKYQYAYNNPLRYIDPDGHDPDEVQGRQDVVKIEANPPVIMSVKVKIIDELPNGSVPVGGEFEITYKYRTSVPTDGTKPEDLGRVEAIDYDPRIGHPAGGVPKGGGTFADANNLGTVGDPKVKVNVSQESVTVEKTERFIVKPRKDSGYGASAAINYKIVVKNPNTGQTTIRSSKGPDTLFNRSLPYIPVRNVPKTTKRPE